MRSKNSKNPQLYHGRTLFLDCWLNSCMIMNSMLGSYLLLASSCFLLLTKSIHKWPQRWTKSHKEGRVGYMNFICLTFSFSCICYLFLFSHLNWIKKKRRQHAGWECLAWYLPPTPRALCVLMGLYIITTHVEGEVSDMVQDIGSVERLASTPSKWSLHFTRLELLPGFYSHGYFFMLLKVLKGVNLLSKRRVHAEKPITFRNTRHKSPYEIFVHSGVVPVTRFSYVLLSLWSSCQFCYILLHLFLHSESLLERQGGHLFITPYLLLTPLSYCFLFLI